MKKFISLFAVAVFAAAVISVKADAKCQYGSDWSSGGKRIVVCTKGDSFSDRKKAKEICEKIKGSSCSSPSTFSSSCGNNECYDESGAHHYSLSGY
ncbi:MAG TPA: hypothetical protein PK358_16965 [Spirochaetota bacterium]|nr:hypothetical protein [Spirochaetota bacterium]HPJ36532.1 hypothetical protein [Spirochaetota bacterium]